MKLIYLNGLQASGKSTWAKQQVLKSGGNTKRVNKDDIRSQLDAGKWSGRNEKFVVKTERALAESMLQEGYNVIIDNTGFNPTHKAFYKGLAKKYGATFEAKFFDVPLEECIKRDLERPNSVGERVIRQTYKQYLAPQPAVYRPPEGKPDCYIFDIDGTLAHMSGDRSPYDWSRVGEDSVDVELRALLHQLRTVAIDVIVLSGRDSICHAETERWLAQNDIRYESLFMRAQGDMRKDTVVKKELFDNHVRDNYRVRAVFDDRDAVVEMWRSLGLKCYQVAPGDF